MTIKGTLIILISFLIIIFWEIDMSNLRKSFIGMALGGAAFLGIDYSIGMPATKASLDGIFLAAAEHDWENIGALAASVGVGNADQALRLAATSNSVEFIEHMAGRDTDILADRSGEILIALAAESGALDVAGFLLENGVSVQCGEALSDASLRGDLRMVDAILNSSAADPFVRLARDTVQQGQDSDLPYSNQAVLERLNDWLIENPDVEQEICTVENGYEFVT